MLALVAEGQPPKMKMITKISERKDNFCKDKSWNVEVCVFSEHFNVMVEISVDA